MNKTMSYALWATAGKLTRLASRVVIAFALTTSLALSADLVDPTRPPMTSRKPSSNAPVATNEPRVTAIFESGERRVAVFDGQVVKAGDRVGEIFIEAVSADGVRFRRNGRVDFARLPKQAASVRQKIVSEESEP